MTLGVIFLMSHHLSQPYIYLIGRPSQGADINWNARVQVNNKLTRKYHIFKVSIIQIGPDAQFFTHHAFEHLQKNYPLCSYYCQMP